MNARGPTSNVKSNQLIGTENVAVTESPSLSTCTIHIERRGGRGDAGARALERHLRRLSGVHDVDVSFLTGDARITYDGSITSEETIRDAVRDRHVSIQDESETATDDVSTRSELRREVVFVGLTLLGMAVDEPLCRRLLALSTLDHVDEPADSRLVSLPCDLNLQAATLVDRPAEHFVTGLSRHGH